MMNAQKFKLTAEDIQDVEYLQKSLLVGQSISPVHVPPEKPTILKVKDWLRNKRIMDTEYFKWLMSNTTK